MTSARPEARSQRRSLPVRLASVWRHLPPERRLAAIAAIGLFFTLFLPWYQETVIDAATGKPVAAAFSLTGWGAFSFVEAAVLLVALSVLLLLFQRAEGRAFHLPGGDGWVITIAGGWTCFLIIWRMLDKQGTSGHGQIAAASGIEWGMFVALAVAGLLTYAGTRIRASRRPEPALPGDDGEFFDGRWQTTSAGRNATGADPEPQTRETERSERRSARRTRRSSSPASEPTTATAADPTAVAPPRSRSSWRPADHPTWTEPAVGGGWATEPSAPHAPRAHDPAHAPTTDASLDDPTIRTDPNTGEQLTIPLEDDQ